MLILTKSNYSLLNQVYSIFHVSEADQIDYFNFEDKGKMTFKLQIVFDKLNSHLIEYRKINFYDWIS
jgi:hypothetical protein